MYLRILVLALLAVVAARPQNPAVIEGSVKLSETGEPLSAATVMILELDRTMDTDEDGRYRFEGVPAGTYHLEAHVSSALTHESKPVTLTSGETATLDFALAIATMEHRVTVTASGRTQNIIEAIQSVESRDSFELAEDIAPSIGETLANRPGNGIAKRSFGPGTERPVIRGFDGDRVMIMQDGIRSGGLSSQSGDHGELINTGNLDRVEIVKGPGTLLYGGSAVGGVVNAISRHHAVHEHPHQGTRGFISGSGGSANGFASGSAGVEFGKGKWMVWGGGSGQSSGEYDTPEGVIPNSDTKLWNGFAGFGRYSEKTHFTVNAGYDDAIYGVPFANEFHGHAEEQPGEHTEETVARTELDARRQAYQLHWGLSKLGPVVEGFSLRLGYSRWLHDEVEVAENGAKTIGTEFDNKQFTWRGTFEQATRGRLSGRFGVWGMARDYSAAGEEALSPPVDQRAIAGYVLEEVDLERVKVQFGARVEYNNYDPDLSSGAQGSGHADLAPLEAYPRSFTGGSAAAGVNIKLWQDGAFVANYTHSNRPPAMEELYNFGPHVGNLAFEVGDPALKAEQGNGLDLSLRHNRERLRMEGNFFYYDFGNFIFPFATGDVEDGLRVIKFTQADTRYTGAEFNTDLKMREDLWLNLGVDYVNAQEKSTQTSLPRIPPLRGRLGFDWHWKGLEVRPELILAGRQGRTFTGESETAGYVVTNLKASYTFTRGHFIHQFALNTFNIGDTLYRNHSSFIKDLAPEIGRGIRFTYRVRFF